ncbi:MAG: aminomethyl transferase family protein [Chloroflexi bacterium]|nr:aminomethyl transferase family protein [Chloroflexota bacterium]
MRLTPFHPRTSELVDPYNWSLWNNWLLPDMYAPDHKQEYLAIRTACGVFDMSPIPKYHIYGPDAQRFLDRIVTQDMARLAVGRVSYTPWCDDAGKIIDDGMVSRLDEQFFRLTTGDPMLYWLEDNAVALDVTIDDVTESLGVLALQGPFTRELLKTISNADFDSLRYFSVIKTELAGIPVDVSRTGYTGDLGYEIWVELHQAVQLWDLLFEAGAAYRLRPFGDYALDMARIEAGLLLTNADFNSSQKVVYEFQKSTPLELGLGWTVKLNKPRFIGQNALKQEKARGSNWVTMGLEIDLVSLESVFAEFGMPLYLPTEAWSEPVPLYAGGRQIGKATSGTWSPILKKYIAIARLKPRYARPGTQVDIEVTIDAQHKQARATVVKMPFFNPPRKRAVGGGV